MFVYSELQDEVKRSAVRDKAGTEFDTGVKNAINRAIYRLAREARWRSLRRESTITTVTNYTTGTGAVSATKDSPNITVTGATFITDGIEINRRIDVGGSTRKFRIKQITGETTLVLNQDYDGTTSTTQSYEIYPQGTYNLPIQASHEVILWHEQYGHPYQLNYITSQESFASGLYEDITSIPTHYRMWGEDMVIEQVRQPSVISVVSSSASDTSQQITVFGTVSGYPDFETINVTGTASSSGSKTFSSIERVSANTSARTGRITVSANSGQDTIAVLPVGNTTREVRYRKIQIRPLPTNEFPIFVYYYKTPYMLVNDNDIHELGEDFDSAVVFLATAIMRGETSQKEGTTYLGMYKDELKTLKRSHIDKIDWLPRLQSGNLISKLGGRFHRAVSYGQIGTGGWFGPRVGS